MERCLKRKSPWSSTSADIVVNLKKSARWQNHENIIPFVVYSDQGNEKILVSEYPDNHSLEDYLQDPDKRSSLTWAQRLEICLGAARGLEYIHSGLGAGRVLIHRNFNSSKILLDDNLQVKISGLCLSRLLYQNQPQVFKPLSGMRYYLDPLYKKSGILTMESDIYSFGVVMFEMLTGMLAYNEKSIGADPPETLINLVRRHYNYRLNDCGLDKLIDPDIKYQINIHSLRKFIRLAYRCIDSERSRSRMHFIIKYIEDAQGFQAGVQPRNHRRAALTDTIRSHQYNTQEHFPVPLEEIKLATRNFVGRTCSGRNSHVSIYRGRLSEHWQNREAAFKVTGSQQEEHKFHNELAMVSGLNNENIISFIGYYDDDNKRIMVSEYAINGSLYQHLQDPNKRRSLTWAQRLKICIGTARGLNYLHSGLGEGYVVIHRNMSSSKILLDDNWEAKICGFGSSRVLNRDQPLVYEHLPGSRYNVDHISERSHIMAMKKDIYSFGVVLFEILCGKLADKKPIDDERPEALIDLVRRYSHDGIPDKLIDPDIRYQTTIHSLHAFEKLAHQCISFNIQDRPSLNMIIKRLQDIQNNESASIITTSNLESFLIPLTEIKLATIDFSPETRTGDGGFGVVYKGELSKRWKNCTVAIKRLDPTGFQGKEEFLNELKLISSFHHPNIIRFVGYCDEANEMIIVNKYASNHSLDSHLEDLEKRRCLTWEKRLNICLGAAKGFDYLHSGVGKDKRIIHRDIKSGNILLDENMEAKICDFGFSRQSPRNQQHTEVYTKTAGTYCYLDPACHESGILRKESDIYSFGVVLFEMISGILAYHKTSFGYGKKQYLMEHVRYYYNNGPDNLIDPCIKDQIDSLCFDTLSKIAYQCVSLTPEERPTMDAIVNAIEVAIDFQEEWQRHRKASRADSPFNLKKALDELEKEKVHRSSDYGEFYSYAFRYCLTDEKQRSIDIESTCELLKLVLGSRFRLQVDLFIEYLRTQIHYKAILLDQWVGFYRFCNEISSPYFSNYDKKHAWPLILDYFVEWVRSKQSLTL